MTVKKLIEILKTMPEDAIVICDRYSDFMRQEPPTLQQVIRKSSTEFERYYPNHFNNEYVPKNIITVCHFEGN